MQMPPVGTRVMVRHRLPAGSVPPLTDVIGHLVQTDPTLQVRTKRGDVVAVAVDDVVVIKALGAAPVRTADIRNLEHAAALAWPGVEQQWVGGWLLRSARGVTHRGNSAVPLESRPIFGDDCDRRLVCRARCGALGERTGPAVPSVTSHRRPMPKTWSWQRYRSGHAHGDVELASRPDDEWLHL